MSVNDGVVLLPSSGHLAVECPCPLCASADIVHFSQDRRRAYWHCQRCDLVFAERKSLLDEAAELAIYQFHQNDPMDIHYRQFLMKLSTPLLARLSAHYPAGLAHLQALDFGSGPGPTLYLLMAEAGLRMANYDPYFANDPSLLTHTFDLICATEAIEHFYQPADEWQLWLTLLRANGYLGLMTKLRPEPAVFANWHYKNDPTHVSFFSRQTFEFLAHRDGLSVEFIGNDVILLQKYCRNDNDTMASI